MSEVIFDFNGNSIHFQAESKESLDKVIDRFCIENNINRKRVKFLYKGVKLNENLTVEKINLNNNNFKRLNEIICPECYKNIFMEINDYKINLKNCINKHNKKILIRRFEGSQLNGLSKIICNNCKKNNLEKSHNNIFYKCLNCKMDICPACYKNHNKEHKIINYSEKNNICDKHYAYYENYCTDCNKNICPKCFEDHNNHNVYHIYYFFHHN
jgi:hypothetical protein